MSLDTLDKDEIIQFSKLADDWWNEEGPWNDLSMHSIEEALSSKKMFEFRLFNTDNY